MAPTATTTLRRVSSIFLSPTAAPRHSPKCYADGRACRKRPARVRAGSSLPVKHQVHRRSLYSQSFQADPVPHMKTRTLGPKGPSVSALGLGCMGFSEFYTSSVDSDREAIAVIHRGLDAGLTFLDTADAYGPFKNEIMLGKAIAGRRDKVFVATKFGIQRSAD